MTRQRVYTHKEIATAYFPDQSLRTASRQLAVWIDRDEDLLTDLQAAGYLKGQRIYTPRQVEILFDHLGIPQGE